ncbi:MAG: GSCFA domain-containing protein [Bacteroidia bacterium]
MNFHLSFPIKKLTNEINYSDKLFFMGSCFAESIGTLTQQYKFNSIINPHGILYNPASIKTALIRYTTNTQVNADELFYANDSWNSWEHHSRYSNPEKTTCINTINEHISNAHEQLKKTEWMFITFGSAFIYSLNGTNKRVGNCHKVPQKEFSKTMLTVSEIISEYDLLLRQLKEINTNLKVVFTVSPVRYVRDGVIENTLSKARLIEATHTIVATHSNSFYFPAYELMMDDLRDYRFYKTDLVHPTEQAIEYIFEKLVETTFSNESKLTLEKVKDILKATQHSAFNSNSESFIKFKRTYAERCKQLQKEYSFLDLSSEIEYFEWK